MDAQKILELKESSSGVNSAKTNSQRMTKNDFFGNAGDKNFKGKFKFVLSVVYFLSVVFFLSKLLI